MTRLDRCRVPTALVLHLALTVTLLAAASAIAQPRHEDYARLPSTDEAVRRAAGQLVEAGVSGLETVIDGGNGTRALSQADQAERTGERLGFAGRLADRADTSLPELLVPIGPASERLGASVFNVTNASVTLLHGDPDPVAEYLAHRVVDEGTVQARQAMDVYDEHGIETERLREVLDRIDAEVGQAPLPRGAIAILDPARVHYGQRFHLLALDSEQPGAPVHVAGPGRLVAEGRLDEQGFTEMRLRAPWDAEPGRHEVRVEIGEPNTTLNQRQAATRNVTLNLTLTRVPTEIVDLTTDPPGEDRELTAHLVGPRQAPIPAAPLHVQPFEDGPNASGNATQTAVTDARGRAAIALSPDVHRLELAYPGNRTHTPATRSWTDPWTQASPATPTEEDRLRELFEQVGVSSPPTAPSVDVTLIVLVAAGMLLAVAIELEHVAYLERRWGMVDARADADGNGSAAGTGSVLPDDHPLLLVLEQAGIETRSLTLREAAVALDRLGAPRVFAWARRHERAYYGDEPLPEVPADLVLWVEDRLDRSPVSTTPPDPPGGGQR